MLDPPAHIGADLAAAAVDAIHWWGNSFDPALSARPAWWKMTIWIDAIFCGPFYVVAIYAYLKGKEWLCIRSIIYSSVMLTNVTVILGEEMFGTHATPQSSSPRVAPTCWNCSFWKLLSEEIT